MNLNNIIEELYNKLDAKDKQINELMLENGKLKKQTKLLEHRLETLNEYINNEKNMIGEILNNYTDLQEIYRNLYEKFKASEQKILKAIEYINRYSDKGYNFGWILEGNEIDRLLEILGG